MKTQRYLDRFKFIQVRSSCFKLFQGTLNDSPSHPPSSRVRDWAVCPPGRGALRWAPRCDTLPRQHIQSINVGAVKVIDPGSAERFVSFHQHTRIDRPGGKQIPIDRNFAFYRSGPESPETTSRLYLLWDVGYTLGHSVRTRRDAVRMADADLTAQTAMMEARFIDDHPFVEPHAHPHPIGKATRLSVRVSGMARLR